MWPTRAHAAWLAPWLDDEQPGPDAIAGHVLTTGHGRCWTDRPQQPRAILVETAGNYLLAGDPDAVDPAMLRPLVAGFVAASAGFVPLLHRTFPDVIRWDRVVYAAVHGPSEPPAGHAAVRPLTAADTDAIAAVHPTMAWIAKTWGGAAGLAASGHGWGAFHDASLVAVACTFFVGARHYELAVATDPGHRGRGLATACAWHAARHAASAGRIASWSSSPDNQASRRVAEKLGFSFARHDALHTIGITPPQP